MSERPRADRASQLSFAALADRIEAATPSDRDRYMDFLRVAAILMVIFGHWVVRVVTAPDGAPETSYLLAVQPGWQWATLVFQVMPLIFLVGGALNAESWRRSRADGVAPVHWIRRRTRRLLKPTAGLLVIVVPLWMVASGVVPGALVLDPGIALVPLWFIAVYLTIMALTPLTLAIHERGWSLPAITVAVVLAGGLDVIRLAGFGPLVGTQPLAGLPNFLLIWFAIHQLGHLWADDRLPAQGTAQAGLALAGAVALALCIGIGPWPLTMIPVEGTFDPNNAAPPTVALFALALVQVGLVLLLRAPITRALGRPRLWAPVALLGGRLMTLFLWHQVAMVVVTNLAATQGWLPLTEEINARWWAQQPLWVAAFAVALAGLAALTGRLEQAGDAGARDRAGWGATTLGLALSVGAIAGFLWLGLADTPMLPALPALALFLAGYQALRPRA